MTDNPYKASSSDSLQPPVDSTSRASLGCIFGAIGLLVIGIMLVLPAFRRNPEAAYRTRCKNNLKQIMLAMHNYHDVYEAFPPQYTTDANGNRLHSWRTLLLPYLEQGALYQTIDLTKPWNHPNNAMAYQTTINTFQCRSSDLDAGLTTYHALAGDGLILRPTEPRRFRGIKNGTSNTIAIVEVPPTAAVHWMYPGDRGHEQFMSLSNSSETAHRGGVQAAFCDGSVRFISNNASVELRTALSTIDGGESVKDRDW